MEQFDGFLLTYDRRTPFNKIDQLKSHQMTIQRRRLLGSAASAATDRQFLRNLHWTLQSWGIGKRASRLLPYDAFAEAIGVHPSEISRFDGLSIDDQNLGNMQ